MLVLSRTVGQKIVFPSLGITVQVLKVGGLRIRLGIEAPSTVPILRDEIVEKKFVGEAFESPPLLQDVSKTLRVHIREAMSELKALQQQLVTDAADDADANVFRVFRVFAELQAMNDEVASHCGDSADTPNDTTKRVLLVDDNQNETHLLASFLRCRRIEVATTSNGGEAMNYLANNEKPDFVLLDMRMPRFDGRWTIDVIRGVPQYTDLKVFGVSGIHPVEYGVEIGPGGLDGWFRKPLDPETLVSQIINHSTAAIGDSDTALSSLN